MDIAVQQCNTQLMSPKTLLSVNQELASQNSFRFP